MFIQCTICCELAHGAPVIDACKLTGQLQCAHVKSQRGWSQQTDNSKQQPWLVSGRESPCKIVLIAHRLFTLSTKSVNTFGQPIEGSFCWQMTDTQTHKHGSIPACTHTTVGHFSWGRASLEPVPFGPHPPLNHIGWLHTCERPCNCQRPCHCPAIQWTSYNTVTHSNLIP